MTNENIANLIMDKLTSYNEAQKVLNILNLIEDTENIAAVKEMVSQLVDERQEEYYNSFDDRCFEDNITLDDDIDSYFFISKRKVFSDY